ncbi:hypothetical protein TRVA0_016S00122 [Trichomonascus vanleenenianus]|uniref:Sts1p n=1 Tax=Trichomonascus vanleenenianus TaxID=2268995 RepID=UPI003ECA635B
MVMSAVLPPRTGWGFEFSPKPESLAPPVSRHNTNEEQPRSSQKRKASFDRMDEEEDGSMDMFNSSFQRQLGVAPAPVASPATPRQHKIFAVPKVSKRVRTHNPGGRNLPILRVVETLDRRGLQNLIEAICQSHPHLADEISSLAPRVTVTSALENLKKHLESVFAALPYKGDQRNDYAYLRVRPHIEEFLSALGDYTSHFLPPNELQASNTLAFLDGATALLNKLPVWTSALNNQPTNRAYDGISAAWETAITEASKRANGLGLAHGGWESKLYKHNDASGNRLAGPLSCINEELAWLKGNNIEGASVPVTTL